ncbi:MAG: hypothetical protein SNJ68_04790 [Cyanobacteriota bacterium]
MSRWIGLRGNHLHQDLIDLSTKRLIEYCGLGSKLMPTTKESLVRNLLLEKVIIRSAGHLVKPSSFFPYSFEMTKKSLQNYFDFQSLIILVYHISGFTLLVDMISVILLEETKKDIIILYGLANLSWISKLKKTWIQSDRLHFVLNDQNGLFSLRHSLRKGAIIIALIDIPQEEKSPSVLPINLMDHTIYFKTGILRLASRFNIPILPISHRFHNCYLACKMYAILRLSKEEFNDPEVLAYKLGTALQPLSAILCEYPTQWLLWHKLITR